MVFVDTAGWVAYFNKRDSNHIEALKRWKLLRKEKIILVTTDYILDEMITLLKARRNTDTALRSVEAILSSKLVRITRISDDIFTSTLSIFRKYEEHQFSFTDCTSFEVMNRMRIKNVFTFDSDFKKAGFEII